MDCQISVSGLFRIRDMGKLLQPRQQGALPRDHCVGFGVLLPIKAEFNDSESGLFCLPCPDGVLKKSKEGAQWEDLCVADACYRISFDPPASKRANEYHDLEVVVDRPGAWRTPKPATTTSLRNRLRQRSEKDGRGMWAKKDGTNVLLFVPGGQ
jgi:hypothetical protein